MPSPQGCIKIQVDEGKLRHVQTQVQQKKKKPQLILKIFILWMLMKLANVLQVTSEHKKMILGVLHIETQKLLVMMRSATGEMLLLHNDLFNN